MSILKLLSLKVEREMRGEREKRGKGDREKEHECINSRDKEKVIVRN